MATRRRVVEYEPGKYRNEIYKETTTAKPWGTYRTPEERAAANKAAIEAANSPAAQAEKAREAAIAQAAATTPNATGWGYKTPEERAEMIKNAASSPATYNPSPLGDVDPIYQTAAGTAAGTATGDTAEAKELLSEDYLRQLADRQEKGFSYDMNANYLYQQYKDQYMRQGSLAMQDAMGKAAALTGGYGNTYAERTGQATYNQYLQELNDRVPELYQLAMNRYQMEGDELQNMYSLLNSRERQAIEDERYDTQWQHTLDREAIDDERYNTEWQHALEREGVEDERYNTEWDYKVASDKAAAEAAAEQTAYDRWLDGQKLALETAKQNLEEYKAEIDAKYKMGQLSVAEYNAETSRINSQIAAINAETSRMNAQTSAYNAQTNAGRLDLETQKYLTEQDDQAARALYTGAVDIKTTEDWNRAVNKTATALKNGTFKESDLYKYDYDTAIGVYAQAEELVKKYEKNTIAKGTK